jgi:hypothetical protein
MSELSTNDTVFPISLCKEAEHKPKQALEHENVRDAAEDRLELE